MFALQPAHMSRYMSLFCLSYAGAPLMLLPEVCSDMSTFFDDIKIARPTSMLIIPRIANMIYDQAQEKIRKSQAISKQVCCDLFAFSRPTSAGPAVCEGELGLARIAHNCIPYVDSMSLV